MAGSDKKGSGDVNKAGDMIQPVDYPAPDMRTERPHVIVVGAGVAGLAAAHRLLERGHDITLIEANSFVGGKLGAHRDEDEFDHLVPTGLRNSLVQQSPDDEFVAMLKEQLRKDGYDPDAERRAFGMATCPDCPNEKPNKRTAKSRPCCKDLRKDDWHEHCYHMYLNWYHNFWQLMRDIGVIDAFEPMTDINYLRPDPDADPIRSVNPGSLATAVQNMTCGVASPADVYLHSQALRDLLATSTHEDRRLDQMSVEAFMRSHRYMTEESRKASHRVLAKAFAAPTAMASAATYKSFLKFGARMPEPTMWLLNDHTQDAIFTPWLRKIADLAGRFHIQPVETELGPDISNIVLEELLQEIEKNKAEHCDAADLEERPSFTLMPLTRIAGIELDPDTGEFLLRIDKLLKSPSTVPSQTNPVAPTETHCWRFGGQLVLAVPPRQLARLVHSRARDCDTWYELCLAGLDPELVNTTRLAGAPIMTLDVVFKRPLERPLPRGIVLLLDSKYEMSVYDNAQMWKSETGDEPRPPMLSICASDAQPLMPFADQPGGAQTIVYLLLQELSRYIGFDPETDVYRGRTHLQTNAGAELFINAVDTWHNRPKTTTAIPDLFIAGDYVQTPIDVVTIEAAAMSGLMAAEAVRRRTGKGEPVDIIVPDVIPGAAMQVAAAAGRPFAYAARMMSEADQSMRKAYEALFPRS